MERSIHRWSDIEENCSVVSDFKGVGNTPGGPQAHFYSFIMHVCVTGFLCVFGLVGNFLSLIVFFKYKARSLTFYLLRPLAIADNVLLLMTIALMVLPAVYPYLRVLEWPSKEEPRIADWAWPIGMAAQTASIWSIVLVAMDRFIAICQPFKARKFRRLSSIKISIGAVVIFSVFFNIPRLFEKRSVVYFNACTNSTETGYRKLILKYPGYRFGYFVVAYTLIDIIIPLAILSYVNTRLIMELRRGAKRRSLKCQNIQREDKTMTKLSVVIVTVFTICQPPSLVTQVLDAAEDHLDANMMVFRQYYVPFSNVMVVLNSSVNFAVCYIFCRGFRRSLAKLLTCGRSADEEPDANRNNYSSEYWTREMLAQKCDHGVAMPLCNRAKSHSNCACTDICFIDENDITKV